MACASKFVVTREMETSSSIQTAVGIKLTHEWQYYKKGETRDDPIDANEMPNITDRTYKWKEDRDRDILARVCSSQPHRCKNKNQLASICCPVMGRRLRLRLFSVRLLVTQVSSGPS